MSKPRISVIIPTRHRDDLLAKCLDCLAPDAQTLPAAEYEVIVSDDGSTTTVQAMMSEKYPWALWTQGPRRGPAANRNHGAAQARGEWIAFTDDDCLPTMQWLQAYAEAIEAQALVYEGKTTCEAGLKSPLEIAPVNLEGGYLWSCNMMVQKALFEELGGFDDRFPYAHMEDVDLRERIKATGRALTFVADAVVDHPPRRVAWGDKLGASAESSVFYDAKHGTESPGSGLLLAILKTRLRSIKSFPRQKDSVLAMFSLVIELVYVWSRLNRWKRRHLLGAHSQTAKRGN